MKYHIAQRTHATWTQDGREMSVDLEPGEYDDAGDLAAVMPVLRDQGIAVTSAPAKAKPSKKE